MLESVRLQAARIATVVFAGTAAAIPVLAQGTAADSTKKPMQEFTVSNMTRFAPGNPAPRYPQALQDAGKMGVVVAQMVVDTSGTAIESTLKILRVADPAFADAIKEVIPKLRFIAAKVSDRKVKQLVQIQFRFGLQGRPAPTDTVIANPNILQLDVVITGATK
jgi:TonB family protein